MKRQAFTLLLAGAASLTAVGCAKASSNAAPPASTTTSATSGEPATTGEPAGGGTPSAANLKKLTIDEVSTRVGDGKTFIFDANSKEMWAAGHVPGAKWVDEDNVTAHDLPADKTAMLIFYCHDEG